MLPDTITPMDYLKETQHIAHVTEEDVVVDQIEKWEAHKKGILHRAFTLTISYKDTILLQYRKHPVFDGVFDATISSHPIYEGSSLQEDQEAIKLTMKREWDLETKDLCAPVTYRGKIYYQARDPKSEYIEHEVCHIYSCEISDLKLPNLDMAYGFCLKTKKELQDPFDPLYPLLAPWVHITLKKNIL
jgi:isopentenyl-diphosphate delta-isomerase